ncbi:MAG: chemotaxis protein CheB [Candidatus Promineifilaceae bacterium]
MTKKKQRKLPDKEPEKPNAQSDQQPDNIPAGQIEKVRFPIVGLGASAGGLAAFADFFKAMPNNFDPGMAFILVQHLARDYKSILRELIQEYTSMPVFEVEDGLRVQPNTVYIIPPNRDLALFDGKLHLLDPIKEAGGWLPINFFFRSLAQDQRERAIGIVLSGTGSDGTLGIRAIKGEGGLVIAQTPESTEYDGMPRSAIATKLVDFVLPPAQMPAQLLAYTSRIFGRQRLPKVAAPATVEDSLNKVFILLRAANGNDFSQYKRSTIIRRIERRMALQHIDQIDEYVRFLQQSPKEIQALFQDVLIGVTSFFRDHDAFAALESQAIPRIFANKASGDPIRIWVPGCSTGEEAYSIAILLQEKMEALRQHFKVQLFATDIDPEAIGQARQGIFPASIKADVSAERLGRFFSKTPDGAGYQIQKNIRDMLIFSEQNLIQDPPFSRLDLISCRNLLIYLNASLQKKLIPLFHYALAPGGLLFLGNSETIGEFLSLFDVLDRKWKLFIRKDAGVATAVSNLSYFTPERTKAMATPSSSAKLPVDPHLPLRELTEQALLQAYAPVSVLVNSLGEILYIHGRTGKYLEPSPGEAGMNIVAMAREGLRRPLTIYLQRAVSHGEVVHHAGIRVKNNGDSTEVALTIRPLSPHKTNTNPRGANLYLVTLIEQLAPMTTPVDETAVAPSAEITTEAAARIAELEQALHAKEEYLQSTQEEMNTANEELKSTNEELQSVNEELQSTNEELETSKEELQSVNEELATVNAELQQKVADLSRTNNDMNNLLAGTGIGTIFVDLDLQIMRFTPTVTKLINLIKTDIGRPVHHIMSNLVANDQLARDIQQVLDTLVGKEVEVQTTSGEWFVLSIRPYRTLENVIEGAVITFVDITRLKHAESLEQLVAVVRDANDAIIAHDLQGNITAWNPAAEKIYGWTAAEALRLNERDRIAADDQESALAELATLLSLGKTESYETQRLTKDGRSLNIWLTTSLLSNEAGIPYAIVTTEKVIDA